MICHGTSLLESSLIQICQESHHFLNKLWPKRQMAYSSVLCGAAAKWKSCSWWSHYKTFKVRTRLVLRIDMIQWLVLPPTLQYWQMVGRCYQAHRCSIKICAIDIRARHIHMWQWHNVEKVDYEDTILETAWYLLFALNDKKWCSSCYLTALIKLTGLLVVRNLIIRQFTTPDFNGHKSCK